MQAVLVLDQTWQPDRVVSFRRACELLLGGKAVAVTEETATVMRSPSIEVNIPAVIQLAYTARWAYRRVTPPCSSRAVLIRDAGECQFVVGGTTCRRPADSVDHLLPRSRGGLNTWDNLVAACRQHNTAKADSTLDEIHRRAGWTLRREPFTPQRSIRMLSVEQGDVPVAWRPFLAA